MKKEPETLSTRVHKVLKVAKEKWLMKKKYKKPLVIEAKRSPPRELPPLLTQRKLKSAPQEVHRGMTLEPCGQKNPLSKGPSEKRNVAANPAPAQQTNHQAPSSGLANSPAHPIPQVSVRKLKMRMIEENKIKSLIRDTQAPSDDKLIDKDMNEEGREINLQSQADGADQNLNLVQSDPAKTSKSQEPVFSVFKNEDLKDTEIKPTSESERKAVKAPLDSIGFGFYWNGYF
ncbi:hypothetical protein M5K25_016151 [Dendrobium thyrsiflorum]|uniref:Uncharacterized protein n=1 Tax=Dendrobium thyrsiflorum TaxID=117978 RepID=A0ABD0UJ23_DENTH